MATNKEGKLIRCPASVWARIKELAERENRSVNNYVATVLKKEVKKHEDR